MQLFCQRSLFAQAINNLLSKSLGIRFWDGTPGMVHIVRASRIPQPVDCDTPPTRRLGECVPHINCDRGKFCSMRLRLTKSERERRQGARRKDCCCRVFNIYEQYVATVENAGAQDVPQTHLPKHHTSHIAPKSSRRLTCD